MLPYNEKLRSLARELRNNMTDAENLLWSRLRRKQIAGYQFYRQKVIRNYIVDFYCPAANLVIEVDGSGHYCEKAEAKDGERDKELKELGLEVLRLSNNEVIGNIEGVMEHIIRRI